LNPIRRFGGTGSGAINWRIASKTTRKLRVVLVLHLIELPRQFLVRREHLAEPDEGAHDRDVHLDGTPAPQNAGEHGHALLGEWVRQIPPAAASGL
jgi:hypothetical protein